MGVVGIRALLSVNTAGLPRLGESAALVGIDWRVLSFAVLISVGTDSLWTDPGPARVAPDLSVTLKESVRASAPVSSQQSRSLPCSEVALALILLVGSALLIRTSIALWR